MADAATAPSLNFCFAADADWLRYRVVFAEE
jgi:hypothetical protein